MSEQETPAGVATEELRAIESDDKESLSTEQLAQLGRFHEDVKNAGELVGATERLTRQLSKIQESREKHVPVTPSQARPEWLGTMSRLPREMLARPGYVSNPTDGSQHPGLVMDNPFKLDGTVREDMAHLSPYELEFRRLGVEAKWAIEYYGTGARARGQVFDPMQLKAVERLEKHIKLSLHWYDNATDSGEWIPDLMASQLVDFFQLAPVLAEAFRENWTTIPRGTGSFLIPVETSAGAWIVLRSTTVAVTSATSRFLESVTGPDSGQMTLGPALMRGGTTMNMDIEEDAAIDVMAAARRSIQREGALAWDDAILNGQVTVDDASHDGTNATGPANGSYNGLRFFCHDTPGSNETTKGGTTLDTSDIPPIRKSMLKFGVVPTDLRLIVSPSSYLNLVADSTDQNVVTREKYGDAATIVTGELARVWGIPVLVSDRMSEAMNVTGDIATAGATTGVILVNTKRWYVGIKRTMEIRMVAAPAADQMGIYGFHRTALDSAPPDTDDHVWYYFNVLP